MARSRLFELLRSVLFYGYGLFTLFLYALISIQKGTFFKRPTEKEKLELRIGELSPLRSLPWSSHPCSKS